MSFKTISDRVRVPTLIKGTSLTQQCFKKECDINNIMSKYRRTGLLEHVNQFQGQYADLTNVVDYHTAMGIVHGARDAFMLLPAEVRKQFDNDPQSFVKFATDPANLDKLRDMGLAPPAQRVIETPVKDEVVE